MYSKEMCLRIIAYYQAEGFDGMCNGITVYTHAQRLMGTVYAN